MPSLAIFQLNCGVIFELKTLDLNNESLVYYRNHII